MIEWIKIDENTEFELGRNFIFLEKNNEVISEGYFDGESIMLNTYYPSITGFIHQSRFTHYAEINYP